MRKSVFDEEACVVCGCTQNNACDGGCTWVAQDLCSACEAAWDEAVQLIKRLRRRRSPPWSPERQMIEAARACRRIQDKVTEAADA